MSVTVGVDSYGNELGLVLYASARGITITVLEATKWLYLAMDWLERQAWISEKYDYEQALEFPRAFTFYDDTDGVVPDRIIKAQYALAASMFNSGDDPLTARAQAVKRERVEGAVEVEYQDNTSTGNYYPQVTDMVSRYLLSSGASFQVNRV